MDREEISKNIRKEATKVLFQAILFVAYYMLLIILGVALFVGAGLITAFSLQYIVALLGVSIRLFLIAIFIIIMIWFACFRIGCFLLRPLFVSYNGSNEDQLEIKNADAPQLFAMVREIARATGNKMPKHVYLTAEVNASVSYNSFGVWTLFLPVRKNLTIGIGLLQGLNQSELKAILSHEFGHFSQGSMRVGIITYKLLLIIGDMVRQAQEDSRDDNVSHTLSFITKWTIAFYNHIEKRNRSLSRYMEFEADAVACHIAGAKSHISALCKTEIMSNRFAVYEKMVFELLKEKNSVKHYLDGYSFVCELLSQDEKLSISPLDVLTGPIGDEALFPSRISIIDGWDTHPSLRERIDNAKLFTTDGGDINTDSATVLIETSTLDKVGLKHQMRMATKLRHTIHWTKGLEHDDFTLWASKQLAEHRSPHFIFPFTEKRVVSFQFPSEEDIASEDEKCPFTNENRNLILEYRSAIKDWQILSGIKSKEYDVTKFLYNGKLYNDANEPLALQKAYLDLLFDRWKELDIKIFKYLFNRADDKKHLKTMYWVLMYANDALHELEPLHSYAINVKQGLDFYRSQGKAVSINDYVKAELSERTNKFLKTLDFDAIISVCGEWQDEDGKKAEEPLLEWKEYATKGVSSAALDYGILNLIEQVWQFLSSMFSMAYNEWQERMLAAYSDKSELKQKIMLKYNLERFKQAQASSYGSYATALEEIRNGRKTSHWIWYIFPQLKGLGRSSTSEHYGIENLEEAKAYLEDETLGMRLREISQALMEHANKLSAYDIFGGLDAKKVKSCMTLFDMVAPNDVFASVLDAFFDGKRDGRTEGEIELLNTGTKE